MASIYFKAIITPEPHHATKDPLALIDRSYHLSGYNEESSVLGSRYGMNFSLISKNNWHLKTYLFMEYFNQLLKMILKKQLSVSISYCVTSQQMF